MSTSPPLDFATLTLQDALDFAILIEEDARERYEQFVQQLGVHHTPVAAVFFQTMARNEEKHRDWLAKRRKAMFGNARTRVNASQLCEVEAPAFREIEVFMTPRQALAVALAAETRAYHFYDDALKHVREPQVKLLFEELREEEVEHQKLVQREIDKLPPPKKHADASPVDSPVAQ